MQLYLFYVLKKKYRSIDWTKAIYFYEKSRHAENADYYLTLARMGEMYLEAKHGLVRDAPKAFDLFTEAAELAIELGKGKLADRYYSLAEKAQSDQ